MNEPTNSLGRLATPHRLDTIDAVCVRDCTLICPDRHIPHKSGNCFSVGTSDGKKFKIVNFIYENLDHLITAGQLTWPVQIYCLSGNIAVIHDLRIPDGWYSPSFCEVCCPESLLPAPQVLRNRRSEARGDRKTTAFMDGTVVISEKVTAKI
jgi:hypothetical protein